MKKIIGIVGWKIDGGFGVTTPYLEWISQFGIPRIIMPMEDFIPEIDLLVLPGGLDINPTSFGEAPGFKTSNIDVFKQYFFDNKLPLYIEKGCPIFGICLGFQQLVAYFGGKLCQDLKNHNYYSSPRTELVHDCIFFDENSKPIENKKYKTNSLHHQGIYLSQLPKRLKPLLGVSCKHEDKKDYVVEAMQHITLPIAGVQFHPEEINDAFTKALINNLLNI